MAFGGFLKQSTAVDVLVGPFLDSTDGNTAEVALSLTAGAILLSKNGQGRAAKNDATMAAYDSGGYYNCELDATDSNTVGQLTVTSHPSGALPVRHEYQVVEEDIYDALFGASATAAASLAVIRDDTSVAIPATLTALTAAVAVIRDDTSVSIPASLTTIDNFLDTEIAAILDDTSSLVTAMAVVRDDTSVSIPASLTTLAAAVAVIQDDTSVSIPATLTTIDNFLDTEIAAILDDTSSLVVSMAVVRDDTSVSIPASLTTIDNFLDTEIAAILDDTSSLVVSMAVVRDDTSVAIPATLAVIRDDTSVSIPATLAVIRDDTSLLTTARGEPALGTPPASAAPYIKTDYLYKAWRNKKTTSATFLQLYNDDAATVDHKASLADDTSVFTQGEMVTP